MLFYKIKAMLFFFETPARFQTNNKPGKENSSKSKNSIADYPQPTE